MINSGMVRFQEMIRVARDQGTLNIEKGSLGWKYPAQKPAKSTVKGRRKASPKKSAEKKCGTAKRVDLFQLCQAYEQGQVDIQALLDFAGKDLSLDQIQEWYINECIARQLAEVRQANGG